MAAIIGGCVGFLLGCLVMWWACREELRLSNERIAQLHDLIEQDDGDLAQVSA